MIEQMDRFRELTLVPEAIITIAIEFSGIDPETEEVYHFYLTSAPSLFTEPDDTPANETYLSRLLSGWETVRSITENRSFLGSSNSVRGAILVSNAPDDGEGEGPFNIWRDLEFNNRSLRVLIGGATHADGTFFSFSDYIPYVDCVIDQIVPEGEITYRINLAGARLACDVDVVTEYYRAFGGAVRLEEAYRLETDNLSAFTLESNKTLEWIGVVREWPSVIGSPIRHNSSNYGITINSTGNLGIVHTAGTLVWSDYVVEVNKSLVLSLSVYKGFRAELWAGTSSFDMELVLETEFPTFTGTAGKITIGRISGNGVKIDCWEARVWSTARTEEQIKGYIDSPIIAASEQADLIECWKFGDGTGTTPNGEKGVADMTFINPEITWVSAYDGDDPEQFGGNLLGVTKPDGWGPVSNIPIHLIDSQNGIYQWARVASTDLRRVYASGFPLVPDEVMLSKDTGEISFSDVDDSFNFTLLSELTAHRYIPGQANPLLEGQLITITDGDAYNGTYRIAVNGISPDGLKIRVTEENGDPVSLSTGDLPAGAAVNSTNPQYEYDLQKSIIIIPDDLGVALTADAVLRIGAGCKVSDVFEDILGAENVDNQLTFDPIVGVYIEAGQQITECELFDNLAHSAMAYWIEKRDGSGFKLVNIKIPNEEDEPTVSIIGSNPFSIDVFTEVLGRIIDVQELPTITPFWQLKVGYARTWQVQDATSLQNTSISAADRQRLSTPFRIMPRSASNTKGVFQASNPAEVIPTYLVHASDAIKFLDLAMPVLTRKRRWFQFSTSGLGLLTIDLDDIAWIQHPDPLYKITTPTRAVISSIQEDVSSSIVSIGVYL